MSISIFSPQFLRAMTFKVGPIILLVRLAAVLALSPIRLVGHLLAWAGQLGESLVDWHDDWKHEICTITAPPVWSELIRLRDRCERAEERLRLLGATVNEEPL